jgi:hypothetical protein
VTSAKEETVIDDDDDDDETYEVEDRLQELRRPLKLSAEERHRRRLGRQFTRIFGAADRDIEPEPIKFVTGEEEPKLHQEKLVANVGDAVVLTGDYLARVKAVRIGKIPVEQLTVSPEQIAFVVPQGVGRARLTLEWLPPGRSNTHEVQIDFDLKESDFDFQESSEDDDDASP